MRRIFPLGLLLLAACPGAAARRIVAIGDLHGDLGAARAALRLAGAIDAEDRWIGKDLTIVQIGDEIDRGDEDKEVLELFDRLAAEAPKAGGAVIPLLGNHELMNAAGDLRYVTPGSMQAFGGEDARRAAFAPGSPLARMLGTRKIYAIVGDTIFVHGGVLPAHVDAGLDTLDAEAHAWLVGERAEKPTVLTDQESMLWTRRYGHEPDCAALGEVLARLKLRRMVVAHSVQPHVNAGCDGKIWRVDVGLAHIYGGPTEVLLLEGERATVLR
jgi:hypothetical protein